MDLLPDDMLSNILGRLPPASLAASRCVRKRWCAVIDGRRLLRADLLPLRLDGFFLISEVAYCETNFFARPSTGRRISGRLTDFVPDPEFTFGNDIVDYCNGLLLLWERVANPATRQWVYLPRFPEFSGRFEDFGSRFFLAYDPFVSPQHFEVILIPSVPNERFSIEFEEESEWPPSTLTAHVFSSTKWRWEERSLVREGKPVGTIADMRCNWYFHCNRGVYARGALHVHCPNGSVMRITLCNNKYQMIESPAEETNNHLDTTYLGKSEKGVYFAFLSQRYTVFGPDDEYAWPWFRVWLLKEEPCGQMVWVLKTDTRLQAMVDNFHVQRYGTPWTVNYKEDGYPVEEAWFQDESEWDFDSGTVVHEDENKVATYYSELQLLGFHPWKEIAFFSQSSRVLSYHMNSSKVQEYGPMGERVDWSFPYTACWTRELLSEKN